MGSELWGATAAAAFALPARPVGYLVLFLLSLFWLHALYRYRTHLVRTSLKAWLFTLLLAAASLVAGQLFLIPFYADYQLIPAGQTQNPAALLAPLGSIPLVLAATALNPLAALIVGMAAGLGRALWQTHQLVDPLIYGLAALLLAEWVQQNYRGVTFSLLRQPFISAPLAHLLIVPFVALATFAYTPANAGSLAAFDLALTTGAAYALPLLVQSFFAGLIVTILVRAWPGWSPSRPPLEPPPTRRSISRRLLSRFAWMAVPALVAVVIVTFYGIIHLSTRLVVNQMVQDAEGAAAQVLDFRNERQNMLVQHSNDPRLWSNVPGRNREALRNLFRGSGLFRSILLIKEGEIAAAYPDDAADLSLSALERAAMESALNSGAPTVTPARPGSEDESILSFVVPVRNVEAGWTGLLIGRVPPVAFASLIAGLQDTVGAGEGFIVDENGIIIAHPDEARIGQSWALPRVALRQLSAGSAPGIAFEGRAPNTNARELVYYQPALADHPWTLVISVPYEVVLSLALQIGLPLTILLSLAVALYAVNLFFIGRDISRPIAELARASQGIASGQLDIAVHTEREDELGQLGRSFDKMRRALKRRLDEQTILVEVGKRIAASLEINEGMPAILQGVVRASGAAGARAVVVNPHSRIPMAYSEGAAGASLAPFDRRVMAQLRQQREMILSDRAQVQALLGNHPVADAIDTLVAFSLTHHGQFQGSLWLAFTEPVELEESELNTIRTLASQASVVVANALLFASANSGRRRLAAVLASTSDAVIVTDQNNRVLLINPAMAAAFNLKASDVIGRQVHQVIEDEKLRRALATGNGIVRDLEITAGERTFHANVSPIGDHDQSMGRVAVLHDISQLKAIDQMKSEFVHTVSHDLRNPLNYIRGYATMLPSAGPLNDQQQLYTQKVVDGVEQMLTLVNHLLDLGRIEAGVELELSPIAMGRLLTQIAADHREAARARGMELITLIAPDLPQIQADSRLVRQAIANLVTNAIKYAPETERLILRAFMQNGELVVSVTDQGPGIDERHQGRLFEKFYRVPGASRANIQGSGLGLAIVRSIAERHGGRAWCRSRLGEGSTFYIAFPADESAVRLAAPEGSHGSEDSFEDAGPTGGAGGHSSIVNSRRFRRL